MAKKTNGAKKAKNGKPNGKPKNGEEKNRRGRAPTEGEPLKRVLVFLGQQEIDALRKQLDGDRGISKKVREIVKAHLAK